MAIHLIRQPHITTASICDFKLNKAIWHQKQTDDIKQVNIYSLGHIPDTTF